MRVFDALSEMSLESHTGRPTPRLDEKVLQLSDWHLHIGRVLSSITRKAHFGG